MRSVPNNPFHEDNKQSRELKSIRKWQEKTFLMTTFQRTVIFGGAAFVLANVLLLGRMSVPATGGEPPKGRQALQTSEHDPQVSNKNKNNNLQCQFRQYPPRRYYGLQKMDQPDFLKGPEIDYVYGKYPIMITPSSDFQNYHDHGKLCVDQSEWLPPDKNDRTKELPFADGTNPSILSLERLQPHYPDLAARLEEMGGHFVATICMTDSQCSYQDSSQEIIDYKLSKDKKATVVQTLLLILDDQFRTLLQTTIYLERDAPWGRKYKRPQRNKDDTGYEHQAMALDDARLFIHLNSLWVSYREGPSFGYEQQVLNEIHLELTTDSTLKATIKASESASFCCGRNMALMEHLDDPTQLQSLTWADPVTVIDVDDGRTKTADGDNKQQQPQRRRQLGEKKKKSHFHGTNAFMVYLPKTDEFLGIGHFHRPSGRDAFNPYARFGHHYTHTFFAISSRPPFRLNRLSQEFVLPSKSHILQDDDAEIIQFLSGLDVISKNGKDYAVIAYGINDCEGAAVYMEMDKVNDLLIPVDPGKEVVDLMKPLEAEK